MLHETAGTITSSPGINFGSLRYRHAETKIKLALDPLFTITENFEPIFFANSSSKASTRSPMLYLPDLTTLFMASISCSSQVVLASEYFAIRYFLASNQCTNHRFLRLHRSYLWSDSSPIFERLQYS